jgi:uncharacterized membrane protein (DUF485 family)
MKQFIKNILASFDIETPGFSAKKLSAFVVIILIISAHIAWLNTSILKNDWSLLLSVLAADYAFIATCLGMSTYQNLQNNKNNSLTLPPNQ